eukprot:TRINITY_DN8358_c2_g1_i1.p1 TRINITY_DN8358_c2_g1~~TRINITY_DN8358_c2_g1_i1.p1  ORF type:complete len:183 (-),score=43.23 TRINITY_DN8358_c2_g1_i1:571-1119(-)
MSTSNVIRVLSQSISRQTKLQIQCSSQLQKILCFKSGEKSDSEKFEHVNNFQWIQQNQQANQEYAYFWKQISLEGLMRQGERRSIQELFPRNKPTLDVVIDKNSQDDNQDFEDGKNDKYKYKYNIKDDGDVEDEEYDDDEDFEDDEDSDDDEDIPLDEDDYLEIPDEDDDDDDDDEDYDEYN